MAQNLDETSTRYATPTSTFCRLAWKNTSTGHTGNGEWFPINELSLVAAFAGTKDQFNGPVVVEADKKTLEQWVEYK